MGTEDAQKLIDTIHAARVTGEKAGLAHMRALLAALGDPQKGMRLIHVAGTNGKGSVCAMLESMLRACGYATGLYTSPYLTRYNERIRLDGLPVSDALLVQAGRLLLAAADELTARGIKPTAFELGTALAFLIFRHARVDVAVIETGLGGRLDPTNVIAPDLCCIAAIGMDHMELLGDSLVEIAGEKAGIIKPRTPVALYPQPPAIDRVFADRCRALDAPLLRAADYPLTDLQIDARGASFHIDLPVLGALNGRVNLPGAHQAENARLALCAMDLLAARGYGATPETALAGLAATVWPGRLEWIEPRLFLDGAHNPDGARALCDYLRRALPDARIVLLTGMMRDKQPETYARLLAPYVHAVVATQVAWPRALPADDLAAIYRAEGREAIAVPRPGEALKYARALRGTDGVLLVAGSLYLVGDARGRLLAEPR